MIYIVIQLLIFGVWAFASYITLTRIFRAAEVRDVVASLSWAVAASIIMVAYATVEGR